MAFSNRITSLGIIFTLLWPAMAMAEKETTPAPKAASDTWFRTHGNMKDTNEGKRFEGRGGLRMVRDQLYGWSTDEGARANQPAETTNEPVNKDA